MTINVTRGDSGEIVIRAFDKIDNEGEKLYEFQAGELVRLKVFEKKACENVVLQKDFPIEEATESVSIFLTEQDTRIGEIISKPVDYWYEIELNPDTEPQTIVGYDDDGAKIFRLYPEGRDLEDDELTEEEKNTLIKILEEKLVSSARIGYVTLLASAWEGEGNRYIQVVTIDGVTENTQVDLTPSVEQILAFYDKDLTFVTENRKGVIIVYAIGQKPQNDYTIQVTLTEVRI
jgi:hypothetical protein